MKSEVLLAAEKFTDLLRVNISSISVSEGTANILADSMKEMSDISAKNKLKITPGEYGIVETKEEYEKIVPSSYRDTYTYEQRMGSYPWLWLNLTKNVEDREFYVQVKKDGWLCKFTGTSKGLGELLEGDTVIKSKAKNYISWEIVKDLGISKSNISGKYEIILTDTVFGTQFTFEVIK